jgi:hypothetical protein
MSEKLIVGGVIALSLYMIYRNSKTSALDKQIKTTVAIQKEFSPDNPQANENAEKEVSVLAKRFPNPDTNPSMSEETAAYNNLPSPLISQSTLDNMSETLPDGTIKDDLSGIPTPDINLLTMY